MKAYILGTLEPTHELEVFNKIKALDPSVKQVDLLYGRYDFIVHVDATDKDSIDKVLFDAIRHLPGIASTETLVGAELKK